jgi:hypothetical protein
VHHRLSRAGPVKRLDLLDAHTTRGAIHPLEIVRPEEVQLDTVALDGGRSVFDVVIAEDRLEPERLAEEVDGPL